MCLFAALPGRQTVARSHRVKKMLKNLGVRRVAAAATTAVSLVAGASVPAQSSEIQRAYREHMSYCLDLLFSNKAEHGEQCLPNTMPNTFTDNSSGSPVIAPPPPPETDPPESSYPSFNSSVS